MEVSTIRERDGSLSSRKRKIIQLERLIESMISIEEYELCIQIRNIITKLKQTDEKIRIGYENEVSIR